MIPQLAELSRAERRAAIQRLEHDNADWPERLRAVPEDRWPVPQAGRLRPSTVYRSRRFLVQVFEEGPYIRLSVNHTSVDEQTLRWSEDISWNELQRLKAEAGFADREAVEIYPMSGHEVNVANMRHLWVLPEPMPFSWRKP